MYYPSCENKCADQLRGYREADLRLCFRICKKSRFSHNEAYMGIQSVHCKLMVIRNCVHVQFIDVECNLKKVYVLK